MLALLRDLAREDDDRLRAEWRRELDDEDAAPLSAGTTVRLPIPRAPGGQPAVICTHGSAASPAVPTHLQIAPDGREWRDPATWRRLLAAAGLPAVTVRLEVVSDPDTMRGGRTLGEWAADAEVVAYDEAPREVHVQMGGGVTLRATLLAVVDGVARYAPSPTGLAKLRALWGGR